MLVLSVTRTLKRFMGAISSKRFAAYSSMIFILISPITKIVDFFFNLASSALDFNKVDEKLPPVLVIVSPPRSGGTIIYQSITKAINCSYFSNLHWLFPRTGSRIFNFLNKSFNDSRSFNNYYGYTAGLFDVSEGNGVFDNILHEDNSNVEIRRLFLRLIKRMRRKSDVPVILKNVRNYHSVKRLAKAVPEVVFLRVKRDLNQVIQSEIRGYHELGTFHPVPEQLKKINYDLDPVSFAVKQILAISSDLDDQGREIGESNWIEVSYEEMCDRPITVIDLICSKYLNINCKPTPERFRLVDTLKVSNKRKVSLDIEAQIIKMLNQR